MPLVISRVDASRRTSSWRRSGRAWLIAVTCSAGINLAYRRIMAGLEGHVGEGGSGVICSRAKCASGFCIA